MGHLALDRAQLLLSSFLAGCGALCLGYAVLCERRMHRHRRPGVSYGAATLRTDGGWRRADLFTEEGLRHQARASRFGVAGAVLWLAALGVWTALGSR